ncbi:hypothetical protein LOD99_10105 [Oopsacas minuta]|uniref:Uncharacterized protein n=1 Tax=Oopsacas minuta TaxID=111878 RepID=A0AAV7KJX8_9METZ|nr:hypothetical protein LOD99_10105 [Oopsacas minuta]
MARASSPSLEAVLGDVPQESDLELALSLDDDLPPPPPNRSHDTSLGNDLEDLLHVIPAEEAKHPVTAPKPKAKPQTKSDVIIQDIYKMLAEIERDIELNLTPKNKLAKSDTFGMTNVIKSITPANKSPVRNAEPPPIKTKPKPVIH